MPQLAPPIPYAQALLAVSQPVAVIFLGKAHKLQVAVAPHLVQVSGQVLETVTQLPKNPF